MSEHLKRLLVDIRFYLLLFFVLRMYGITDAPLESSHSWRQVFTNMVARNFTELGLDMMHPRTDLAGTKTGIVGSEFPLLNALIHWLNVIFGFQHWYGRLINLTVTTAGLFYFNKLIKGIFNVKVAFHSTIILTVSIWFAFARKIMPDTFSVSLVIIGLYFAHQYLVKGSLKSLFFFFLFATLGMLCKVPAASIFFALPIVIFIKNISFQRKFTIGILAFISLGIVSTWYFIWTPYLVKTYEFQLFIPKGILEGFQEIKPHFGSFLKRFYFDAFHSFIAFAAYLGGLVILLKQKQTKILLCLLLVSAVFIFYAIKTGSVFPLHSYYIIPFVPVMSVVAGYFIAQLPAKFQYSLVALIAIESVANQQHDFVIKEKNEVWLSLESNLEPYKSKNDLIITSGGRDTRNMYYAHSKGWVAFNSNIEREQFTDSLANLGARFLLIRKNDINYHSEKYPLLYDDDYFSFYNLQHSNNLKLN